MERILKRTFRCSINWIGAALIAVLLTACLDGLEGELTVASLEDDTIYSDDDDLEERLLPLGETQVVYVNFDGVTVDRCPTSAYCSNAMENQSRVIESFFDRDSITWQPYTNTAGRRVVIEELEKAFDPYNIEFTTSRPSSGVYAMLVIASNTEFGGLGVAPLNCGNTRASDIAFVYRAHEFEPATIANAAVHELGHAFGLAHVEDTVDYMFFQANQLTKFFTRSNYDIPNAQHRCTDGEAQDAPELLLQALGARVFDGHFADIEGSVHEDAIYAIYEAGVTAGCSSTGPHPEYCPNQNVRRGQMAVFLSRAVDLPQATQNYFDDTNGAWYEDEANRMAEAGITQGCAEREYCGNDDITRAQMAVFLARAFDLPPATQNYFSDTNGAYYEDSANRLAEAGITLGCGDGKYCGQDPVTRGQMASFLARALGLI